MGTRTNGRQKEIKPPPVPYIFLKVHDEPIRHKHNNTEKSVAFSCLFHVILLSIMAFTWQIMVPAQKPIAIELSFSTSEEPIDIITDGIDMISSEFALENLDNSLTDTNTNEMSLLPSLGEPKIEVSSDIVAEVPVPEMSSVSDVPISDLLTEVVPQNDNTNNVNSNSVSAETANDANQMIAGILTGLTNGVSNNAISQKNAGTGIGGGIEARLASYGAKTGDVQISIAWNSVDDIDLHVTVVTQMAKFDNINWVHKIGNFTQGMLDIDMNANEANLSHNPVENIFWPTGSSPSGIFNVHIHYFRSWSGNRNVPVTIRVKNGDDIRMFNLTAILGRSPQLVTHFVRP